MSETFTFAQRKEAAAADCEAVAKMLTDVAAEVRAGDIEAFERFWLDGGTEEGDAKVLEVRERLLLRYLFKHEHAS